MIIETYIKNQNKDIFEEACGKTRIMYFKNDSDILLKLISWDENKHHKTFKKLVGKKVKITIEII